MTLDKTIAVHCPYERQAEKLMQEVERLGWKWIFGDKPSARNEWNTHKEDTVYWLSKYNTIQFSSYDYARNEWNTHKEDTVYWLSKYNTIQFSSYDYARSHPEEGALYSFEGALKELGLQQTTATEYHNLTADAPAKYGHAVSVIDQRPPCGISTQTDGCIGKIEGTKTLIDEDILIIKKPKKMSTLNTMIRDRFFKKEETKVCELIEETQDRFEPLVEIIDYIIALRAEANEIIEDINDDIEDSDKKELKKDKNRLEKFIKDNLDDKLLEQFIMVGKKLIK